MAAGDLGGAHAAGGGLVERVAHGLARGLARRRGAAEVLARPREQRARRLDRRVQAPGDLLVGEAVERAHHEHVALALGQPVDVADQRSRLGAARELVRQLRGHGRHAVELDVADRAGAAAAQLVDARVVREPQQPGARLERDDATAQRGVHAQEHVLQHVVGIVARGVEQSGRLAAQRRAVAFEHDRERLFVACGEAREEGAVLYWSGNGGVQGSGRPASMGQTFRHRLCVVSSSFLTDLLGRRGDSRQGGSTSHAISD